MFENNSIAPVVGVGLLCQASKSPLDVVPTRVCGQTKRGTSACSIHGCARLGSEPEHSVARALRPNRSQERFVERSCSDSEHQLGDPFHDPLGVDRQEHEGASHQGDGDAELQRQSDQENVRLGYKAGGEGKRYLGQQ